MEEMKLTVHVCFTDFSVDTHVDHTLGQQTQNLINQQAVVTLCVEMESVSRRGMSVMATSIAEMEVMQETVQQTLPTPTTQM